MNKKLIAVFFLALILRFGLITSAYHGDLNNNISWGKLANEQGFNGFYGSSDADEWPYSAPNQPPLYLLMFSGTMYLEEWIGDTLLFINNRIRAFPSGLVWFWEDHGETVMAKLPSILADLGIASMIYHYIIHKTKDRKKALLLTSVWLFNPVVWYNSSVWGQTDAIVNFIGLLTVVLLLRKDLFKSAVVFTISLLFKGSLAIFAPILFLVAIKQKHPFQTWIKSAIASLLTLILISLWFHPNVDLLSWLFNLYKTRILPGEIGYLTANAFNFWWIVDSGKVLDGISYFGLTARFWGIISSLGGLAGIVYWLNKKVTDKKIFFSLAVTSLVVFLFMTRMHERYLYPFFPPATILLAFLPSFWIPYLVLSASHLLNLYHLFWAPSIPILENLYELAWFPVVLAMINIAVFFCLLRHLRSSKL